jgi:hypothetical protein
MRCRYCKESAGLWRRRCRDCRLLWEIFAAHREENMPTMFQRFRASGVAHRKIVAFFDADPTGTGAVRDQMAADMTNELLAMLGQHKRQSAEEVRQLRQRGEWTRLGERPREPEADGGPVLTALPQHTKVRKR